MKNNERVWWEREKSMNVWEHEKNGGRVSIAWGMTSSNIK